VFYVCLQPKIPIPSFFSVFRGSYEFDAQHIYSLMSHKCLFLGGNFHLLEDPEG
jgi:hypothetical protein